MMVAVARLLVFASLSLGLLSTGAPVFSGGKRDSRERNGDEPSSAAAGAGMLREAMYYDKLPGNEVQCRLCFRGCLLEDGERGECRNKLNVGGTLYTLVYGLPSAIHIDPVEKEPQHHFLPGSMILCFGTSGCNFRCRFCQNWSLSQRPIEEMEKVYAVSPEDAVEIAVSEGIPTISFTYNEPTSFYEYMYDIAVLAKARGLNIIVHTNGAMKPEPLVHLLQYVDAVTVDLKGFTEEFYEEVSKAELGPVLKSLQIIKEQGVWLEIVNLVIPTLNDDPGDLRRMCEWIRVELGAGVPIHFSRFFPQYRLTQLPPTPIDTLETAYRIARDAGLEFVSIGNVPGHKLNSTFCPGCGKVLVRRVHFQVMENNIAGGQCRFCGRAIPGIWKE